MGRPKEPKQIPFIGGHSGPVGMGRITKIQMGDELAGGEVVAILWYSKYRAFIVCEHKKYFDIHHYRSDTTVMREFKGREYPDNLYTYKTLSKKDFDLKNLMIKLVSKIKYP